MADKTFYFYDLETSGLDAKNARIMQFAGQRTDMNLKPIGEPDNILVQLSEDILPSPYAVLVHGVTPQKAQSEGITEPELFRYLDKEVFTPGTIAVGFNTIRFDDEFLRYGFWRNFVDPYAWAYADQRSRWDIIDLARMARALRPEGIKWPVVGGKATNKLENLAAANNLAHENAHDALSDVQATIELAQLIKTKQPKLFDHYLDLRLKKSVQKLLNVKNPKMLVHTSGMLNSTYEKTTIVWPFAAHPTNPNGVLVYDLRHNPDDFASLSADKVKSLLFDSAAELKESGDQRLPIKGIFLNKSPALAPVSVLDEEIQKRIGLSISDAQANSKKFKQMTDLADMVVAAHSDNEFAAQTDPEAMLYDGFLGNKDKGIIQTMSRLELKDLPQQKFDFSDPRLKELWFRYRAKNAPKTLSEEELSKWKEFVKTRLSSEASGYNRALNTLAAKEEVMKDDNKQFLLQELYLWAQSLVE